MSTASPSWNISRFGGVGTGACCWKPLCLPVIYQMFVKEVNHSSWQRPLDLCRISTTLNQDAMYRGDKGNLSNLYVLVFFCEIVTSDQWQNCAHHPFIWSALWSSQAFHWRCQDGQQVAGLASKDCDCLLSSESNTLIATRDELVLGKA